MGQFLRWVMQSPTLDAIAMGHFARAQVTTLCLIYLPRRGGRLSLGPRTTRIRTQDPLVLPLHHGCSVCFLFSVMASSVQREISRQDTLSKCD